MHYPVPMTIPEGRWRRRAVVATALAGVVAVALVIANPSLLRRGEREPIPTGGPVDDLEVVCSDAVTAGFCSDPEPLADEMRNGELVILESHVAADGVTSPRRLRVAVDRADRRVVYRVKFKPVPPSLDESNHCPRRELAAYALQRLLFDPERYVVAPTVIRCLTTRPHGPDVGAPFENTGCVLGVMSYWLEDTRDLTDDASNSATGSLAERLGDLNVFGKVASHRDAIGRNFLLTDDDERRAFAVDNGLAFGAREYHPLGWLGGTWGRWHGLPVASETVERLSRITREQLDATLLTVAQLELRDGLYHHVAHEAPWPERGDDGVGRRPGAIQLGLTTAEVADVHDEVRALAQQLNRGSNTTVAHSPEP